MTITINKKALEKQLRAIPKAAQKKVVVGATRKGANVIARQMRKNAPVRSDAFEQIKQTGDGVPREPGFLKKNIRSRRKEKRRQTGATFSVGPVGDAFYGLMIEGGFYHKKSGTNIPANPWMRPAFEAKANEAAEEISESFWTVLKKELAKL